MIISMAKVLCRKRYVYQRVNYGTFFFTEKPTAGGSTAASRGLVRHEDAVLMEHLVIPKEFTEQPHGRQMWTPPNMR